MNILQKKRVVLSLAVVLASVLAGCGSPDQNAEKFYESGMALIAKKDDLGARVELLKAIKYKSDKVDVWRALAGIDERTKSSSLFLDLRRIVELDPKDIESRIKLARIMVAGGAVEPAQKLLDVVNDGDKPNAEFHALLATILLKSKDPVGGVQEAQRAFEIDPNNAVAGSILAAKKVADGDTDGALKLLNALSPNPATDGPISLQKMQIYASRKEYPQAEALLRRVIALNPSEPAYQGQLIQLLVAQRKFDEAEKELRSRASVSPSDSKSGLDLVRFLRVVKGPLPARAELEARIAAGGDVFDFQFALAELNMSENKTAEAIEGLKALVKNGSTPERKLSAQLKLADLYVSRGNMQAAEPLIAEIIEKDRRNIGALKLRAVIKIENGQIDGAISDVREALNDQPKSPELLVLMGVAYERGGKNELADRQYADALKSSGSNPEVALRYVGFLQRRSDLSHAEDVLIDVLGRYPNNMKLLSSLGQVKLARQDWAGALTVADTVAKFGNDRALADQFKAAALAGQNKIDESIAALEDAHKAAPDGIQPVVALVSAYVKQGKPDKAIDLLQDVQKRFPKNAQLLVLIGQVQASQKKESDAVRSFKEAIIQQPKDPLGYNALSDFYTSQKNLDEAGSVLQSALKELPTNLNIRLANAGLEILRGNHDAAISLYNGILKDQPTSTIAINNLVSLLLDYRSDKENLDRATSLADSLKNADVPQFQDTYGWAQYRRGDYKGAIATLEAAAAKLPNLAAVHYHLGMTYAALGDSEKATTQMKIALGLEPEGTALSESIRSAMK